MSCSCSDLCSQVCQHPSLTGGILLRFVLPQNILHRLHEHSHVKAHSIVLINNFYNVGTCIFRFAVNWVPSWHSRVTGTLVEAGKVWGPRWFTLDSTGNRLARDLAVRDQCLWLRFRWHNCSLQGLCGEASLIFVTSWVILHFDINPCMI